MTLIDSLDQRAGSSPDAPALIFIEGGDETQHTYDTLSRRARAIAVALRERFEPGDRLVLVYPPGLPYIEAFFGCLYAGIVAVPAYPPDPLRLERTVPRLAAILEDAGAAGVLTTSMLKEMAAPLVAMTPALGGPTWIATDEVPDEAAKAWSRPSVDNDSLAFVQYTSGSTGVPKGVMLSHGNLLANLALIKEAFKLDEESRGVIWLPPYHDMGLIGGILSPLHTGFPVWLTSPLDFLRRPTLWLELISQHKATHSGGPNFAYELCARKVTDEEKEQLNLSSWRLAFNGAEPIRKSTMDSFAAGFSPCGFSPKAFYPCYGLAEATLIVSGGEAGTGAVVSAFQSAALENHWVADSRVPYHSQATVTDEEDRTFEGAITDVSRNGLFVAMPAAVDAGAMVRVRFTLDNEDFACRAEVVQVRNTEGASDNGIGLRLLHETRAARTRYAQLIARITLESDPEGPRATRFFVGCGSQLSKHSIAIVNPETLCRAWPNQVGEIWVAGPSVARGYWGKPEETIGTFQAHIADTREGPFLRTGDLGFFRDSELYITGRMKDLVLIRGVNHYPQDIEATVERVSPAIRPGCVAAFSAEQAGSEQLFIVAEVDLRRLEGAEGGDGQLDELAQEIRSRVAFEHEVSPHAVMLMRPGAIPKTSSGKVQRHACRIGYFAGTFETLAHSRLGQAPEPATEDSPDALVADEDAVQALVEMFEEALGVKNLRPHDSFLRLGGDSVSASQLVARIRDRFGVELPLRALFDAPTPSELALAVEALIIEQLEGEHDE